jgi:phospholipase D1/2
MSATGPIVESFTSHFVERWNFVKKVKKEEYSKFPPLTGPPSDVVHDTIKPFTAQFVHDTVNPMAESFARKLNLGQGSSSSSAPASGQSGSVFPSGTPGTGTYMQLVRSATEWSQGVPHEKSIQNAYISLIENATRTSF